MKRTEIKFLDAINRSFQHFRRLYYQICTTKFFFDFLNRVVLLYSWDWIVLCNRYNLHSLRGVRLFNENTETALLLQRIEAFVSLIQIWENINRCNDERLEDVFFWSSYLHFISHHEWTKSGCSHWGDYWMWKNGSFALAFKVSWCDNLRGKCFINCFKVVGCFYF